MRVRFALIIVVIALGTPPLVHAENTLFSFGGTPPPIPLLPAEPDPGLTLELNGDYAKIDDDHFLLLQPKLTYESKGFGFALELPIAARIWDTGDNDRQNDLFGFIRGRDYDEWTDLARTVSYVRFGQQDDEFLAQAGQITISLGHGSLMHRFNNALDRDHPQLGANVELDNGRLGFEAMIGGVLTPTNSLFGLRLFGRPMTFGEESTRRKWRRHDRRRAGIPGSPDLLAAHEPLLDDGLVAWDDGSGGSEGNRGWFAERFGLGGTVVLDPTAPLAFETTLDNEGNEVVAVDPTGAPIVTQSQALMAMGLDAEFRLIYHHLLKLTPYVDVNHLMQHGSGLHLGANTTFTLLSDRILDLTLSAEYRMMGDGYIPRYFDYFYQLERNSYPITTAGLPTPKLVALGHIDGGVIRHGYHAEADLDILRLVRVLAHLDDYDGPNNTSLLLGAEADLWIVKATAYLYRRNFDSFDQVMDYQDDGTLALMRLSLRIVPAVDLVGQYWITWRMDDQSGSYQPQEDWSVGINLSINLDH